MFWSYDGDTHDTHDTADAARARCQEALDFYADQADEGWAEEVDTIRWGLVLGHCVISEEATIEELRARGDEAIAGQLEAQGCDGYEERELRPAPGAAVEVLAERAKQRARWGDDHDDVEHADGQLAAAASYLADPVDGGGCLEEDDPEAGWAVSLKARHDRRQQLVIAAALLLAEVERLDRASAVLANLPGWPPNESRAQDVNQGVGTGDADRPRTGPETP